MFFIGGNYWLVKSPIWFKRFTEYVEFVRSVDSLELAIFKTFRIGKYEIWKLTLVGGVLPLSHDLLVANFRWWTKQILWKVSVSFFHAISCGFYSCLAQKLRLVHRWYHSCRLMLILWAYVSSWIDFNAWWSCISTVTNLNKCLRLRSWKSIVSERWTGCVHALAWMESVESWLRIWFIHFLWFWLNWSTFLTCFHLFRKLSLWVILKKHLLAFCCVSEVLKCIPGLFLENAISIYQVHGSILPTQIIFGDGQNIYWIDEVAIFLRLVFLRLVHQTIIFCLVGWRQTPKHFFFSPMLYLII